MNERCVFAEPLRRQRQRMRINIDPDKMRRGEGATALYSVK
jgi:hypothetical protein